MKTKEIKIIKQQIKTIKKENIDDLIFLIKNSISNLIHYLLISKNKMDVPKNCLKVIQDFKLVIKEEKKILELLMLYAKYIDEEKFCSLLNALDDLNKKLLIIITLIYLI